MTTAGQVTEDDLRGLLEEKYGPLEEVVILKLHETHKQRRYVAWCGFAVLVSFS